MDLFNKLYTASLWDVGVSINRSNSLPLDKYTIFPSKALADAYASHNAKTLRDALIEEPTITTLTTSSGDETANINADLLKAKFSNNSYPGQIVAVVTDTTTTVYYIDAANTLQEVGGKVEFDGNTIKQDADGKFYVDLTALGGVTEEKVLEMIAAAKHASAMIVDSVDTENNKYTVNEVEYEAVANVVYYVKDVNATGEDAYKEYLLVDDKLTLIGSTTTDLSNYYNKEEVDVLIKDFITADDIPDAPVLNLIGTKDEAEEGEVMLLADLVKSDAEGATDHDLVKTYAAAATKDYVDTKIGEISIPGITLNNLDGEVEPTEETVSVIALEGLEVANGEHTINFNDVKVVSVAGLNAVKDRVAELEGLKIEETYATKEEVKAHTDAAEVEFAKLAGIGGEEGPATVLVAIENAVNAIDVGVKSVEVTGTQPTAEDGEVTVLTLLEGETVDGAVTVTGTYSTALTKTYAEETYAKKTDIPEIPNLEVVTDNSISDVKIEIPGEEEGTTVEVDGLVTVLRKVEADGHKLTETRVALPTVAYIEDMIADVTGGESAGEVLAQLNNFKTEVASTYATKAELVPVNTKLAGIGGTDEPATVVAAIAAGNETTLTAAKTYADEAAANATVKWEEMN